MRLVFSTLGFSGISGFHRSDLCSCLDLPEDQIRFVAKPTLEKVRFEAKVDGCRYPESLQPRCLNGLLNRGWEPEPCFLSEETHWVER